MELIGKIDKEKWTADIEKILIDFLSFLNENGYINDYDFVYETQIKKFINQIKINKMEKTLKNNETAQLGIGAVRRSCSFCQFFQHEEIGDSDFGGVYAENATCSKYLDTDKETEEDIPNFDRELERDCCKLDFWRVVEVDNVLSEKLAEESDRTGKMDETYELFKELYNYA